MSTKSAYHPDNQSVSTWYVMHKKASPLESFIHFLFMLITYTNLKFSVWSRPINYKQNKKFKGILITMFSTTKFYWFFLVYYIRGGNEIFFSLYQMYIITYTLKGTFKLSISLKDKKRKLSATDMKGFVDLIRYVYIYLYIPRSVYMLNVPDI